MAATLLALALPAVSSTFRQQTAPASAYRQGEQIDLEPRLYQRASLNIFFFSRFSCGACQASKSLMASLISQLVGRADINVMLITGDALPDEERRFAQELGLNASSIYPTDLRRLRLRQVPTTILVSNAGTILMVREGLLTESDRVELNRLLSEPSP